MVWASYLISEEGISPDHSAEYTRTLSRNASLKADALFYNPAGLALMPDGGIFIMANLQNTYRYSAAANGLWGYESADLFNNFSAPMVMPYFFQKKNAASSVSTLPNDLFFVYRRTGWAAFAGLSILQGRPGGTNAPAMPLLDRTLLLYNSVLASRLSRQLVGANSYGYLKRSEVHAGATAGAALEFLDGFSGAVALRYIYVHSRTRAAQAPFGIQYSGNFDASSYQSMTLLDTEVSGSGLGVIAGIDFQPVRKLTLALRAEYYPPLVLVKRTRRFFANPVVAQSGALNEFSDGILPLLVNDRLAGPGSGNILNILFMDPRTTRAIGNRVKSTYPPSLSLGLSWEAARNLRLDTSADLYFPRARDLDGRERDWRPLGYRLAQSVEWSVRTWAVLSAGYSYHDYGIRPGRRTESDDLLTSHTAGAGASFAASKNIDMTLAASYSYYVPDKAKTGDIFTSTMMGDRFAVGQVRDRTLTRNGWTISIGATFSVYPVARDRQKEGEEHYRKGMTHYLAGELDEAIEEFRKAKRSNVYYRDVHRKIGELTRLKKMKKKNDMDEKKGGGGPDNDNKKGGGADGQ